MQTILAALVLAAAQYNVAWDSPSADHNGSMPLGNGDIGLNAWAQADGTLHLLISKTDAWDDNSRLVKVGKVVIRFDKNPFAGKFRQELDLQTGSILFHSPLTTHHSPIRLWVDAHHPVIHLTTDLPATASIELWRTNRHEIAKLEVSDIMLNRKNPDKKQEPQFVEPDTLLGNTWYHHNIKSVGPEITAKVQGLTGFKQPDPILNRIFGGRVIKTANGFDIFVLTQQPSTPKQWLAGMDALIRRTGAADFEAHKRWWTDFWNRSWIRATTNANSPPAATAVVPANSYPLRVGEDQTGRSKFAGEIRNVKIPTDFTGAFTLEAEVNPAKGEKGRIFDKLTPGKNDGFLLDAHPGNCLRLICGSTQQNVKDALPAGQWAKIVATVDTTGWRVSVNGKTVIDTTVVAIADEAAYVSQMYALQRFINACAGRGAYPIKFNGSLFTVPHEGDPDYRRWGPGYWWQNTRLPYLSMCAAGDFDLMKPLFKMYADDLLPLCKYRTKLYCGHEGAFYPECIYFWGAMFSETYGWTPFEQREDKLQENRYHKWEWVGGLELCWLMLDYCDHTGDRAFLEKTVLPFCREILTFFDQHYQTGSDGKLVMHPSQALETWWDCTNPMPEVAGCIAVCERLQALATEAAGTAAATPRVGVVASVSDARAFCQQFRAKLPALPLRDVDGKKALAPAERFEMKRNSENPELYAVFPFRLIALGKPNIEWGIEALRHRWDKGSFGWRQDDLFMAYLGLADEARSNLVSRVRKHDKTARFPAFWGPNYDWTPDQDHGGVLLRTFQTMLMQTDFRKIYLLPAWPKHWDCEFKLHAPFQTVLTGRVRNGKVENLKVTPPERRKDVEIWK
ncbi:MAG: LamG domain-containing protein [Verrucomicrobia bacterium]|nr:LamG domain-containing protein [Verrucomicrobiota bacterium]